MYFLQKDDIMLHFTQKGSSDITVVNICLHGKCYKIHCFHFYKQPQQMSKSTPTIDKKSTKDRSGDGLKKQENAKLFFPDSCRKYFKKDPKREGDKV